MIEHKMPKSISFTYKEAEKDYYKVLKKIERFKFILPELTAEEKGKLIILNMLMYQSDKYKKTISEILKGPHIFQAPPIIRVLFENLVNMSLICHLPEDSGLNRYLFYPDCELYKEYLEINKEMKVEQFFNLEMVGTVKMKHDKYLEIYGKYKYHNWTGKTMKENCIYLDRHFPVSEFPNYYLFSYFTIYKRFSQSIHSSPSILGNFRTVKTFSLFGRRVIPYESLYFHKTYFNSTLLIWLATVKIFNTLFKNPDVDNYLKDEMQNHGYFILDAITDKVRLEEYNNHVFDYIRKKSIFLRLLKLHTLFKGMNEEDIEKYLNKKLEEMEK